MSQSHLNTRYVKHSEVMTIMYVAYAARIDIQDRYMCINNPPLLSSRSRTLLTRRMSEMLPLSGQRNCTLCTYVRYNRT